ncbi:Acylphosphatase [uncultured archaeon]|nr:Acylphosphatase [uncultured archaeon]
MKTLRVYITGTVQGPLFKKYLEEQGKKIGVRGFLRQMEDGRIEVVMEGIDDKVKEMLDVCKSGTQHATVKDVQAIEIKFQGFEGFKIFRL